MQTEPWTSSPVLLALPPACTSHLSCGAGGPGVVKGVKGQLRGLMERALSARTRRRRGAGHLTDSDSGSRVPEPERGEQVGQLHSPADPRTQERGQEVIKV